MQRGGASLGGQVRSQRVFCVEYTGSVVGHASGKADRVKPGLTLE